MQTKCRKKIFQSIFREITYNFLNYTAQLNKYSNYLMILPYFNFTKYIRQFNYFIEYHLLRTRKPRAHFISSLYQSRFKKTLERERKKRNAKNMKNPYAQAG